MLSTLLLLLLLLLLLPPMCVQHMLFQHVP